MEPKILLMEYINYEYAINVRDYHNIKCGTQGKDFLAKEIAEYGTYPWTYVS